MIRKRYAHPSNLPALIPGDAFPLTVLVHLDTSTVRQRLVEAIAGDDFPEAVVAAYAEALLLLWSLDGQPTATAVLPQSPERSFHPLPLSALLLRSIAIDTAFRLDLTDLLSLALPLIRRLGAALHNLALKDEFPILLQAPPPGANPLFRFHWQAHPLPIYPRTAARIHRYLVRQLNVGKDITRLLTPILRIAHAFPADRLPPQMYRLDHNEPGIRRLHATVRDVVARLPNTFAPGRGLAADSTQPKYTHQFMVALDISGFSFRGGNLILTPGPRVPPPEIDRLDTDPPEEPDDPIAAYEDRLRHENEEEGILEEDPLPNSPADLLALPDLEGLHPADALRRRAYLRQWAAMRHDFPPDDWASLPLVDLALGYVALLEGMERLSDMDLSGAARLFLYHLLVVTGRPWQWLLSARVGPMPEEPADCPRPVFDPERFTFFFVPTTYPALGKPLRPPEPDEGGKVDPKALKSWKKRWKAHTRIYDEVSLIRALPLDPSACLLAAVYLDLRRQALVAGPLHPDLAPSGDRGPQRVAPLLVTRDRSGLVRPFDRRDVGEVINHVNRARRRLRPDAPPVTCPRLRRAAVSYLLAYGLDPIAVHILTGRHLPGLRAPLFYTLVSSEDLKAAYCDTVGKLCDDLSRTYGQVRPAGAPRILPWEDAASPQPVRPSPTRLYGALYHPRREHIRALVRALLDNARHPPDAGLPDAEALERARHDGLTVLACYLLCLFAGLRVGEVTSMRRVQIDLFGDNVAPAVDILGLIVVEAKADRFYEEYRVLPVPPPLVPLLAHILERSARASGFDGPHDPAFWFYRSFAKPIPVRRRHLWGYLDGIARAAGLREGAPRWHSTRHFLRTFLYRHGVGERAINYILGHQAEGREAGNPFTPSDLPAIFAAYQRATLALADELEVNFDGLW